MAIDPHTFGGTHAGEILASKLNEIESNKLTARVSSFLHHTFAGFERLSAIDDDEFFKVFVVLWRNDRTRQVKFRDDLDTFIKSIIVGVSRDWLRSIEVQEEAPYGGEDDD